MSDCPDSRFQQPARDRLPPYPSTVREQLLETEHSCRDGYRHPSWAGEPRPEENGSECEPGKNRHEKEDQIFVVPVGKSAYLAADEAVCNVAHTAQQPGADAHVPRFQILNECQVDDEESANADASEGKAQHCHVAIRRKSGRSCQQHKKARCEECPS